MKQTLLLLLIFLSCSNIQAEQNDYEKLKQTIITKFENQKAKQWAENVTGVKTNLNTKDKVIAITMDACGGKHGMSYDKELIAFLEKEKVPATLFINARWIDKNLQTFINLASNQLFEIANHGYLHKPASTSGKSIYKIKGTANINELVDEIELNARKIENLTGKRPKYFRSGTAYYDEIAVKIANTLNHEVIGFSILGDKGARFNAKQVENAFLQNKKGKIAIVHFNHPKSGTKNGMKNAILKLKKKGFRFVKLSDYELI
ncbi:MAG: polysaccharide deacetylase [Arcobacter sp.]|nr:MAG: polysaccharide deacetylase [Arcobacter sp.]